MTHRSNKIIPDFDTIVRERQKAIRREIERRGIAIKAIQFDAGWDHPSTVLSYFPADPLKDPSTMSVANLYRLLETKALTAELLTMLLPDGYAIVQVPEGVDYDEADKACRDVVSYKAATHLPHSECGREIGPGEAKQLANKIAVLRATVAA